MAQHGELVRVEVAGRGVRQFRAERLHHRGVVGGAEVGREDERHTARLVERIFEFVQPVGGIDVDEDGADFGGGELGDRPFGAVGRPDADAVAFGDADGEQATRRAIHLVAELRPGVAQSLVARDQRLAVGEARHGLIECGADGHAEQRGITRAAHIASAWRGCA